MFDALTTTQILAGLIALYFVAAGVGVMLERGDIASMFDDFLNQPALGYLGAILAFAIGGAIVAVHNDWSGLVAGFVSLVGWIALIEGVLLLAARKAYLGLFARTARSESACFAFGAAFAIVGALVLLALLFGM